jgi:hypothetical protein
MGLIFGLSSIINAAETFEKGKTYHGFKLLEKRFVKEVNAECYYFEHEKSGARLFKMRRKIRIKLSALLLRQIPNPIAALRILWNIRF